MNKSQILEFMKKNNLNYQGTLVEIKQNIIDNIHNIEVKVSEKVIEEIIPGKTVPEEKEEEEEKLEKDGKDGKDGKEEKKEKEDTEEKDGKGEKEEEKWWMIKKPTESKIQVLSIKKIHEILTFHNIKISTNKEENIQSLIHFFKSFVTEEDKLKQYKSMKVNELKEILQKSGLSSKGKKEELIQRIIQNESKEVHAEKYMGGVEESKDSEEKETKNIKEGEKKGEKEKKEKVEISEKKINGKDTKNYDYEEVDFELMNLNGSDIWVYNGVICEYNAKENCYEKTDKRWDYVNEKIY
tara:strand:- start:8486 stop:9376 length:891 start_codon:yes stop_codon:yes gene_type:complete